MDSPGPDERPEAIANRRQRAQVVRLGGRDGDADLIGDLLKGELVVALGHQDDSLLFAKSEQGSPHVLAKLACFDATWETTPVSLRGETNGDRRRVEIDQSGS